MVTAETEPRSRSSELLRTLSDGGLDSACPLLPAHSFCAAVTLPFLCDSSSSL